MSVLLALGLLELLLLGVIAHAPGAASMPWPGLGLWAGAFAAYVAAAAAVSPRRPGGGAAPGRFVAADGTLLPWIWALGILARLLLLPAPPVLSDDVYRYVWDGWTQVRGLDPFLLPPAEAVESLGPLPGISERINHPEIRTIYPGGAQLLFGALAWLAPSVPLFKSALVAADLGVAWCVWRLARARRGPAPAGAGTGAPADLGGDAPAGAGGPALALLLYLWCPLPIVEVAWSGHLEPLALLPMMAALLAAGKRGALGAGALLGLGAAVKWLPALGLPALARRRGAAAAAAAVAVLGLLWLPYLDAGARLTEGPGAFAAHWEFNPGAFDLLRALLGEGAPPRLAAGAVVLGVVGLGAVRRWSAERALYWALGAALLLTPTLHPWYALWILPLAALRGGRVWILFAGLVALGYWGRDAYLATGTWPRPAWVGLAVHGPLVAGLAWEALRSPGSLRDEGAGGRPG